MKLTIDKTEKKFKPFKLNITVENIEEARLFYHVFNRENLLSIIFDSNTYGLNNKYNRNIKNDFNYDGYAELRNEIENQGFEV